MNKHLLICLVAFFSFFSAYAQFEKFSDRNNDSLIHEATAMISSDSLMSYLQKLEDFGTRFMIAPNRKDIATWLMNTFISMGVTEVKLDSFQCQTSINYQNLVFDTITWQYNVEAKITGTTYPDQEVIVMGHYDSVILDGDPMLTAPGADDNGSGTVALLECARILKEINYKPEQTIIFLATAAEELMYFGDAGSKYYASIAAMNNRNIVMVINNDMIGWDNGTWTVNIYNHSSSSDITTMATDILESFTDLNYVSYPPQTNVGADLQPFLDAGYKGIYFMERGNYPFYHTANDMTNNISADYLAEITKVSLGMILKFDLTFANISNPESVPAEIYIYPNPACDFLNIQTEIQCSSIQIYNSTGILLSGIPFDKRIDLSNYAAGMYFLIFETENGLITHRLVIEK